MGLPFPASLMSCSHSHLIIWLKIEILDKYTGYARINHKKISESHKRIVKENFSELADTKNPPSICELMLLRSHTLSIVLPGICGILS